MGYPAGNPGEVGRDPIKFGLILGQENRGATTAYQVMVQGNYRQNKLVY